MKSRRLSAVMHLALLPALSMAAPAEEEVPAARTAGVAAPAADQDAKAQVIASVMAAAVAALAVSPST